MCVWGSSRQLLDERKWILGMREYMSRGKGIMEVMELVFSLRILFFFPNMLSVINGISVMFSVSFSKNVNVNH